MEGKKRRVLCQDCRAVSEVYGQLLMISIVVIAFATIGVAVFSDGGAVKPEHVPHTDLSEKINIHSDTVQIVHSGGEAIDFDEIEVVLYVKKPNQPETSQTFEMSDSSIVKVLGPQGNPKDISTDGFFTLGDCIVIYTNRDADTANRIDLKGEDIINMFFVHKTSQQVIQRTVLQGGSRELPYWITPHPYGSVYDSASSESLPTELVDAMDDEIFTHSIVPKNDWIYQQFSFGIDADEMGISEPFKVLLKVIYRSHDCSPDSFSLSLYDGSTWIPIPLEKKTTEYNSFEDCGTFTEFDISSYVSTIEQLENLEVKLSAKGNSNNNAKNLDVDFVGIHIS